MNEIDRIERRLKLHDMRVLMSVVQAGSMSKAAERLGTAQPALSRSIAELEHALGVRLLDRSPRGVEPTAYGRALIKRGVAVFDELRQGVKDIEFSPTRRLVNCASEQPNRWQTVQCWPSSQRADHSAAGFHSQWPRP
jgi:DNA-binding transcriptional LysR family regulator